MINNDRTGGVFLPGLREAFILRTWQGASEKQAGLLVRTLTLPSAPPLPQLFSDLRKSHKYCRKNKLGCTDYFSLNCTAAFKETSS